MNAIPQSLPQIVPLAHGEPAGGAAIGQVLIATGMAFAATSALVFLCRGHRTGRLALLARGAAVTERFSGLPGWASLPLALATVSLFTALLGMYWDISLHIDTGRDPGPLANPAHYLILTGLFGIFSSGVIAIALPRRRFSATAIRIRDGWYAPIGGVLIASCGAFALIGFPLDDIWHRLFGQDVTLWGPTHLMLIGGAAMTLIGQAVLLVEGLHARPAEASAQGVSLIVRLRRVALMAGLLVGLSTFQAEFDFGVPQFRFVFEPALLAIAAGTALVCARLWIGRGGALGAAAGFIAIRGAVTLVVAGAFGESTPHFPLYLAEAACVELLGLTSLVRRPLPFAAASGLAIGTVGFAAEWGWSHVWMPLPWTSDLFPEGMALASAGAIAGALVGSLLALALGRRLPRGRAFAAIPIAALVAIMGIFVDGLWKSNPTNVQAQVTLHQLAPPPNREVQATVRMSPADAADGAAWFTATAWQGGGLVVNQLEPKGDGVYRTTAPIPVHGDWKSTIRLQRGHEILGMPIYMPSDPEIPAPKIAAKHHFTRSFVFDHQLTQRETKQGVPTWLWTVAPLVVLGITLGFLAVIALGLGRVGRRAQLPPAQRGRRPRRFRPTTVSTGARP